jgi:hypothetical protein
MNSEVETLNYDGSTPRGDPISPSVPSPEGELTASHANVVAGVEVGHDDLAGLDNQTGYYKEQKLSELLECMSDIELKLQNELIILIINVSGYVNLLMELNDVTSTASVMTGYLLRLSIENFYTQINHLYLLKFLKVVLIDFITKISPIIPKCEDKTLEELIIIINSGNIDIQRGGGDFMKLFTNLILCFMLILSALNMEILAQNFQSTDTMQSLLDTALPQPVSNVVITAISAQQPNGVDAYAEAQQLAAASFIRENKLMIVPSDAQISRPVDFDKLLSGLVIKTVTVFISKSNDLKHQSLKGLPELATALSVMSTNKFSQALSEQGYSREIQLIGSQLINTVSLSKQAEFMDIIDTINPVFVESKEVYDKILGTIMEAVQRGQQLAKKTPTTRKTYGGMIFQGLLTHMRIKSKVPQAKSSSTDIVSKETGSKTEGTSSDNQSEGSKVKPAGVYNHLVSTFASFGWVETLLGSDVSDQVSAAFGIDDAEKRVDQEKEATDTVVKAAAEAADSASAAQTLAEEQRFLQVIDFSTTIFEMSMSPAPISWSYDPVENKLQQNYPYSTFATSLNGLETIKDVYIKLQMDKYTTDLATTGYWSRLGEKEKVDARLLVGAYQSLAMLIKIGKRDQNRYNPQSDYSSSNDMIKLALKNANSDLAELKYIASTPDPIDAKTGALSTASIDAEIARLKEATDKDTEKAYAALTGPALAALIRGADAASDITAAAANVFGEITGKVATTVTDNLWKYSSAYLGCIAIFLFITNFMGMAAFGVFSASNIQRMVLNVVYCTSVPLSLILIAQRATEMFMGINPKPISYGEKLVESLVAGLSQMLEPYTGVSCGKTDQCIGAATTGPTLMIYVVGTLILIYNGYRFYFVVKDCGTKVKPTKKKLQLKSYKKKFEDESEDESDDEDVKKAQTHWLPNTNFGKYPDLPSTLSGHLPEVVSGGNINERSSEVLRSLRMGADRGLQPKPQGPPPGASGGKSKSTKIKNNTNKNRKMNKTKKPRYSFNKNKKNKNKKSQKKNKKIKTKRRKTSYKKN